MSFVATARVPTESAAKYAAQLAKHWSHSLAVEERGEGCLVTFPGDARGANWPGDAVVSFLPEADALVCRIEASAQGQRDGLKGAVESHLNRFAFREGELTFPWKDA